MTKRSHQTIRTHPAKSWNVGLPSVIVSVNCVPMTQDSREVLIELLLLALYLDNHLSVGEDEAINQALDSLGWDSKQPREVCILKAFATAREATGCELKTSEFLHARLSVIEKEGEQAAALTWLSKVLGSDGFTPTESHFLRQIEARFYP